MPTLYDLLGLGKNATEAEIKKAHRALVRQVHPDKENGDREAFEKVQNAYQTLSNPAKRAEYDASLAPPRRTFSSLISW
jgi:curved DNA-binding protein CbpA